MTNSTNSQATKKYPHCQSDILLKAKKCPHCQSDIRSWGVRYSTLILIGILVILVLNIDRLTGVHLRTSPSLNQNVEKSSEQSLPPAQQELLELLSFNCHEEVGFCITEGQVKNISDKSLKNIIAVVMLYTATGDFVTADEAVVEYNPILPGQTVPFRVTTGNCNPAIKKCVVDFKEAWGGSIPTKRKTE